MQFQTISSLPEIEKQWQMDLAGYHEISISLELFKEWWQASPSSVWQFKNGDEVIAAIGIWALKSEVIKKLISGEISEHQISGSDLISIDNLSDHALLYLSGVVVKPEFRRQGMASEITIRLLEWLKVNNPNKKMTIYTWPTNSYAKKICEKLDFVKMPPSSFYYRILM